jgi:tRNA(Arg) A34 adenosine deaminase TadA
MRAMTVERYPDWVLGIVRPGDRRADDAALMTAALDVADASVGRGGGGPFGAVVATRDGEVVGIGWNGVVPECDPTAHAEVIAIRRAAAALGTWRVRVRDGSPLALYTTCAPCFMCAGAIHWAGLPRVVAAATRADAEAIGFLEGPPGVDLVAALRAVGIVYEEGLLRERARTLLADYHGPIYNAGDPSP